MALWFSLRLLDNLLHFLCLLYNNLRMNCAKQPVRSVDLCLLNDQLRTLAERRRERDAVEVLAAGTAVDRRDVEQDDEHREEAARYHETRDDADQLAPAVELAERQVGEEREREQEADDEADQVGVVVDEREQADDEEQEEEQEELGERHPRVDEDLEVLDDLREETGEDAELRPGRPRLERRTHNVGREILALNRCQH